MTLVTHLSFEPFTRVRARAGGEDGLETSVTSVMSAIAVCLPGGGGRVESPGLWDPDRAVKHAFSGAVFGESFLSVAYEPWPPCGEAWSSPWRPAYRRTCASK